MTTKKTDEAAKVGFYVDTRTFELELHRKNGSALPGGNSDVYVRVPALALLFLGPVMGFFFVIFLPFIGFALVAREISHRVAGWFGRKAEAQVEESADHEARRG